ncbi:MAG: DNA methyltransferase [Candidatus Sulfotelmatobacter sp.]|jgi:DNA modification methylase
MSYQGAPYSNPEVQTETLKAFIAKHARPYDPTTDDYDRPPFAADIKEGKNDPLYSVHSYHTKVPPRSIVPYILHYTQPGDLVLDMFCGSGMTGVAAQMCAQPPADILGSFPELKDRIGPRACILNDLSPAACHIAYNYNTPVDVTALSLEFDRIKTTVQDEFDWLYGTEHYEPAVGVYDVSNPEVASRLKNPPGGKSKHNLLGEAERTWDLLTRAEVETRLGYQVTDLPRDERLGDLDVAKINHWVSIPATIQYTIWSDVFRCEGFVTVEEATGKVSARGKNAGKPVVAKKRVARGCHKSIVLWSVAVDPITREVKESFHCPHCNQEWKKLQLTREGDIPVLTVVEFCGITSTKTAVRLRRGHNITATERRHISDLANRQLNRFFPTSPIDAGREMMRHGLLARGLTHQKHFYSPRLLHALSAIWAQISAADDPRVRRALQFAFTAVLHRCSRLNRLRPSGAGDPLTGTLYIGSLWRENHVLDDFIDRQGALIALASKINAGQVLVREGSASDLSELPDDSVDYVFTDPPFGSNLFYADCSMLWESWLEQYTDERYEMVVSDRRVGGPFKTLDDYASMMTSAIREMYRVLKPGRWATIEFNNSDGKVFEVIKRAVQDSGFQIVNMLLLDKAQKSFKQTKGATSGEDVVDKDVLFNLHKPAVVRDQTQDEDHDLEQQLADAVRQHLQALPERIKGDPTKYNDEHRTTATINSMLMNSLIPRGISVGRLNLPFIERVCARYFRKVGQYWYLRGESVGSSNGDSLIEEEVEVNDELTAIAWLRQRVQQKPMLSGELKPLWMRATGLLPGAVSRELSLEMLLSENFWRDPDSNRWREPTDEEREKMNDDRSIRVLHDAERYVAGSLHRTTSDEERCEWIEVLFKACRQVEDGDMQSVPALRGFDASEGYRLITRLFQGVLRERAPADLYARAQKQAGAASNRISQSIRDDDELRKAEVAKSRGPSLFDEVD